MVITLYVAAKKKFRFCAYVFGGPVNKNFPRSALIVYDLLLYSNSHVYLSYIIGIKSNKKSANKPRRIFCYVRVCVCVSK